MSCFEPHQPARSQFSPPTKPKLPRTAKWLACKMGRARPPGCGLCVSGSISAFLLAFWLFHLLPGIQEKRHLMDLWKREIDNAAWCCPLITSKPSCGLLFCQDLRRSFSALSLLRLRHRYVCSGIKAWKKDLKSTRNSNRGVRCSQLKILCAWSYWYKDVDGSQAGIWCLLLHERMRNNDFPVPILVLVRPNS